MKRFLVTATFVALGLGVLTAQSMQKPNDDPDMMHAGGGTLPAGWSARLDSGATKPDGVQIMPMGSGLHFKSGPAGIYYRSADTKSGAYTVSATFMQMEMASHPEAYGLFIGGSDLAGANQKYTYFLVRQDGKYLIKKRAGTATPTVVNWTDSAAVKKADAAGKATNQLSIKVAGDKVSFLVNGTEVGSAPAADVDTSGIAGLRVNHNLSVHVDGFAIK
ncbi:MAG: hypothetical protein IT176_04370 [Acidobacteria bacterium]|nr:hypothetical protein [Acidobacteriota bacterium]